MKNTLDNAKVVYEINENLILAYWRIRTAKRVSKRDISIERNHQMMNFGKYSLMACLALGLAGCSSSDNDPADNDPAVIEWIASFDLRIAESVSNSSEIHYLTDSDLDEYKPVYSPDGSKIAFFRALSYGDGNVINWNSQLFVMNSDGSDVKQLTSGDYMDFNPMWTRDGSDRITFTRFERNPPNENVKIPSGMKIFRTRPDSDVGEEELISDPMFFEMGYSSLKDGRILVRREITQEYLLLTPDGEGSPSYETLYYPFENTYLHKMTIAHSERRIAYMKVDDYGGIDGLTKDSYSPALIAYADFDPINLTFENEVEITEFDPSIVSWYPSWDPDEGYIIWAHNNKINAYFLEDGTTTQISSNDDLEYRYPNVKGSVK
ncbi:MAG: PD40 domain-containing protein [Deltaproteobacteria bacterium]|nr:MAG: PD40 domain-containing protein [Deltaproteobacteria bacterium]